MPERVPSNHKSLQCLRHWSGTSTGEELLGNEKCLCCYRTPATCPLTVSSCRRTWLDMALILAYAQVPGVTVRCGR